MPGNATPNETHPGVKAMRPLAAAIFAVEVAAIECGPAIAHTEDREAHQKAWAAFRETLEGLQRLWEKRKAEARRYPKFTFGDIRSFHRELHDWIRGITEVAMSGGEWAAYCASGLNDKAHRLIAAANESDECLATAQKKPPPQGRTKLLHGCLG